MACGFVKGRVRNATATSLMGPFREGDSNVKRLWICEETNTHLFPNFKNMIVMHAELSLASLPKKVLNIQKPY